MRERERERDREGITIKYLTVHQLLAGAAVCTLKPQSKHFPTKTNATDKKKSVISNNINHNILMFVPLRQNK